MDEVTAMAARLMSLDRIIKMLGKERALLDQLIAALESLEKRRRLAAIGMPTPKRRGRKSMGPEERQEVSRRLKKYWADRKNRTP